MVSLLLHWIGRTGSNLSAQLFPSVWHLYNEIFLSLHVQDLLQQAVIEL